MGGYGYRYESYSAHSSIGSRTDEAFGPVIRRLLAPSSKGSSEDYYDYDYVPRKTIVPIATPTRPYDDDYKHGSPTKAYPVRHDDEWHRQTSPVHVHGGPQRGHELLTKRTMVPIATRPYGGEEYKHSSPTKPYYSSDDEDREWRRPLRDDGLSTKRTMVPIATRPFGGEEYKHSSPTKPYYASDDNEWRLPHTDEGLLTKKTVVPVVTRPYGGDDYKHRYSTDAYPTRDDDKWYPPKADELLTKRPTVPVATTRPHGHEYERSSPTKEVYPAVHDDDKKWHRPQKPQTSSPVLSTDWRRSPRSTAYNGNPNDNEDHKPIYSPNRGSKPVITQSWNSLPRTGTQLSEATNDVDKVAELLKQAAGLGGASEGEYRGNKPTANNGFSIPNDNGLDNPIDARRRYATINSREAERKYNGRRV